MVRQYLPHTNKKGYSAFRKHFSHLFTTKHSQSKVKKYKQRNSKEEEQRREKKLYNTYSKSVTAAAYMGECVTVSVTNACMRSPCAIKG